MVPKLDIIVPHYKEPWEIGQKLFQMIALQRGFDFADIRVTIVNDGGHRIPDECLSGIPYTIRQIDIPHGGVGAARNAGTDAAEADWVMYCDFDDTFACVYSLRGVLEVIPADFDMLWTRILAEDRENGHDLVCPMTDKHKFVFCHGKMYRRQFLIDENIRFTEGMPFQEDSEFNARIIARVDHKRIGEIKSPYPVYLWIVRQNSVTHSGREDEATYYQFRRNLVVTAENKEHKELDHYAGMVTRTVWDVWFMVHGRRISSQMKKQIMSEFEPWLVENQQVFLQVSDDILRQIREIARLELIEPDEVVMDDPPILAAWVKTIVERSGSNGNNDN